MLKLLALRPSSKVETVTRRTMPIFGFRLLIAAAIALLCLATFNAIIGFAWALGAVSAEIILWRTSAQSRRGQAMSPAERLRYLASLSWMNLVWSSLAVVLWLEGRPAFMAAAICMLATQMLHAQVFAGHSRAVLAAVGGPPVATLVCLIFLFEGNFGDRAMLVGACSIMVAYMSRAAFLNARQAQEAEAARARAQQADRSKSAFLAFIGHELRTPLTGVLGMAQALRAAPDGPGRGAQLDALQASGQMMLDLLNDLLDISKIEAGRLELDIADLDINAKFSSTVTLWRTAAEAKGLQLHASISNPEELQLQGDGLRIRQILNNLISNAIKFTERGAVEVTLDVARSSDAEALLSFSIRDQGVGMTADQVARLFQPFEQADVTIARRFGGTGLGLAICRSLVDAMGGEIEVESQLGAGAKFSVRLPMAISSTSHAADADDAHASLASLKVLLVDDNATNRLVGKTLLEALGAEIRLASSGHEALDAVKQQSFDVILMDINMPGMDGIETLKAVRVLAPRQHILALTADGGAERRAQLLAEGFDEVETKPLDMGSLLRAISQAASGCCASPAQLLA